MIDLILANIATPSLAVNKRLDEWVHGDNVDPERMQLPRKESKIGALAKNSRQASPVDALTPTGSDLRRHGGFVGRKRKHGSVEVRDADSYLHRRFT